MNKLIDVATAVVLLAAAIGIVCFANWLNQGQSQSVRVAIGILGASMFAGLAPGILIAGDAVKEGLGLKDQHEQPRGRGAGDKEES